jgi:hypothetical protein
VCASGSGLGVLGSFGMASALCLFECIVIRSLKFSKGARVDTRLPRVLFSLGRVTIAFRIFIVSFKETVSLGSLIQLALQFLNVEIWFLMLAEGSRSGVSFLFRLESLCRKTRPSVCWRSLDGP